MQYRAVLFPVKYLIHGETKTPDATLNYNGRAYVPIRFLAENMNEVVTYDEKTKTITVDNQFTIFDPNSTIRAGHLNVTKSGDGSSVSGQLYVGKQHWDDLKNANNWVDEGKKEIAVNGNLAFYDDQGKFIEFVPFSANCQVDADCIQTFNALSKKDLSRYKAVTLIGVNPIRWDLQVPPNLTVSDRDKQLFIGDIKAYMLEGFTRFDGAISLKIDGTYNLSATLTFFDFEGKEIGKVPLETKIADKKATGGVELITFFTAVGKGDLTLWKSVQLTVDSLTPTT
jgi:hypothetical protein